MDDLLGLLVIGVIAAFIAGWTPSCGSCQERRSSWTRDCAQHRPARQCEVDAYELYHCPPTRRK